MKKTFYLILFLLSLPILILAQETGKDAVVSASNMNVLYAGIINPVEIAVPGVASDRVTATTTNGTIKRVGKGWEVIPAGLSESTITVLVDNKKVSEKLFRVKLIPAPVAVFAGKSSGGVSKDIVLKTDVLTVEIPNFAFDIKFEIVNFSLLVSNDKGDFIESTKGNKLTDKMRSLIADLKPGTTATFTDIRALGPEGKIHDLAPLSLQIK